MSSNVTLNDLLEAGAHFGHQARRWNPAMSKFIYGQKGGVHIFDLVKTKDGLDKAVEFATNLAKNGGVILYVATKRQAAQMTKELALEAGMPYVTLRWLGGTLTNFDVIQKRVSRLKTLKDQRSSGELKKYTKYEQLQYDREIAKLERFLGGIANMNKLPDALFVVDTHKEEVAVLEAKRMGIPVIGLVDSNANPSLVDYIIPTNDDAVKALELIVGEFGRSVVAATGKTSSKTTVKASEDSESADKEESAAEKAEGKSDKEKKPKKVTKTNKA